MAQARPGWVAEHRTHRPFCCWLPPADLQGGPGQHQADHGVARRPGGVPLAAAPPRPPHLLLPALRRLVKLCAVFKRRRAMAARPRRLFSCAHCAQPLPSRKRRLIALDRRLLLAPPSHRRRPRVRSRTCSCSPNDPCPAAPAPVLPAPQVLKRGLVMAGESGIFTPSDVAYVQAGGLPRPANPPLLTSSVGLPACRPHTHRKLRSGCMHSSLQPAVPGSLGGRFAALAAASLGHAATVPEPPSPPQNINPNCPLRIPPVAQPAAAPSWWARAS